MTKTGVMTVNWLTEADIDSNLCIMWGGVRVVKLILVALQFLLYGADFMGVTICM